MNGDLMNTPNMEKVTHEMLVDNLKQEKGVRPSPNSGESVLNLNGWNYYIPSEVYEKIKELENELEGKKVIIALTPSRNYLKDKIKDLEFENLILENERRSLEAKLTACDIETINRGEHCNTLMEKLAEANLVEIKARIKDSDEWETIKITRAEYDRLQEVYTSQLKEKLKVAVEDLENALKHRGNGEITGRGLKLIKEALKKISEGV
jgi:hypothetical protein